VKHQLSATLHAEIRTAFRVQQAIREGRGLKEILAEPRRIGGGATGTSITHYLAGKIIEHMLRNQAFTPPTSIHAALATAVTSGDAGTFTEVSGGAYARQAITLAADAGTSATTNSATIDFGTATANWGTATHIFLMDAATVGNALLWGALTTSRTINSGDGASFAAGELDILFD
jgi:hypothetical protein